MRTTDASKAPRGGRSHGVKRVAGLALTAALGLATTPRSAAAQQPAAPDAETQRQLDRYRTGRNLAVAGGYVNLVGSGVGLAGVVTAGTGYSTAGTYMSYGGTALGAVGFFIEAGGVGMQHSAAASLGRDPGRGLFAVGTTLGVLGVASVGTGIFIGAMGYLRDQDGNSTTARDTAILSCLAGSFVLSTVAHILYTVDQRRIARLLLGPYAF